MYTCPAGRHLHILELRHTLLTRLRMKSIRTSWQPLPAHGRVMVLQISHCYFWARFSWLTRTHCDRVTSISKQLGTAHDFELVGLGRPFRASKHFWSDHFENLGEYMAPTDLAHYIM